jgi:asparagine synthase (glutamine-hydrolysing)
MSLANFIATRRNGQSQGNHQAATAGWRVAFGNVRQVAEASLRHDEQFVVLDGPWASCSAKHFIVAGVVSLTNRAELISQIYSERCGAASAAAAEELNSATDLGLVALLWSKHGQHTPQLLRGAYAFSIWDRHEQVLWLVRDRVGVETLYYARGGVVRYAASRAAAVARTISDEIDEVALRDYLSCAFVPGERTMWRGLAELPPGTMMSLPNGTATVYWQVEERTEKEKAPLEFYSSRLRTTLAQSVSHCLPSREPVGVYLSGGLDSSCVTALAARLHDEPVHSYSIHFGKVCPNELEFSELVAQHCRSRHHVFEITADEMWDLLPETMAQLDDPIGDPLTVPNLISTLEQQTSAAETMKQAARVGSIERLRQCCLPFRGVFLPTQPVAIDTRLKAVKAMKCPQVKSCKRLLTIVIRNRISLVIN